MGELGVDADGSGGAEAAAELMAAVAQADLGGADGGIDFDTFLGFCRKACPCTAFPRFRPGDVPDTTAWHTAVSAVLFCGGRVVLPTRCNTADSA